MEGSRRLGVNRARDRLFHRGDLETAGATLLLSALCGLLRSRVAAEPSALLLTILETRAFGSKHGGGMLSGKRRSRRITNL